MRKHEDPPTAEEWATIQQETGLDRVAVVVIKDFCEQLLGLRHVDRLQCDRHEGSSEGCREDGTCEAPQPARLRTARRIYEAIELARATRPRKPPPPPTPMPGSGRRRSYP